VKPPSSTVSGGSSLRGRREQYQEIKLIGAEPAAANDLGLTTEMEGWEEVSDQPLAGGYWSRRP
jgi:hypothetical protein